MDSTSNLKKRLYQNLLNKEPKQNHLLGSNNHTKSAILKPKVVQEAMNTTAKMTSPVFNRGKLKMQGQMKSPEIPKKIAPIPVSNKLSKEGKAVLQEGKLKSKANLKPHDIFSFYEAFPQMSEDFFYLNRVGHPYDYQIVTYSQRNPLEYMTISFKGVTLYHEKQAEFMTKEQWLADEKIYYKLQKIEFFKQYKISKNFTIWKNRMRRHYMKEMSNLLNESLFFSFEHPRHCLLEIRKITNCLKESTYFMPTQSIQSEQPQVFKQNGEQYIKSTFLSKIKEIENKIVEELQIAITEEIKKFKLENNIKIQDVGDHQEKQHKEGFVYSQEAILRKQYKKVSKLIKLADNILMEAKIELFHLCMIQLLEKIEEVRSSDSKAEWIKCTAKLVGADLSKNDLNMIQWNPTLQGLKNIFKQLINLAITKMSDQHQKITSRQIFLKYKSPEDNQNRKDQKRNTLKYMIQDSPFYQPLLNQLFLYLEQEFSKTQKQESDLIKFINIYTKHKSLPEIKELFRKHSAGEYIQLVREWRQDDVDMHLLPVDKSGGLLIFDYSLLRSTMHEVPKKTLVSFLAQLPQQTKRKYNNLVEESQMHLEHINNYPVNMESFVEFNKSVKKATAALEDLMDGSKALIQMTALIDQNKSQNNDINKINPKKATQNIAKLKDKVNDSNAKYDQSLSKFKKQLEIRITKVQSTVKQLSSRYEQIPFDTISTQIYPTLEKLRQIFPSIQKLQEEAQSIQQIEYQLSLPSSQLDEVHSLYKKSIDVKNLWECKQKWNDLLLQIRNKHYKDIDCKQLKAKWEHFAKKNNELLKSLPHNQVLRTHMNEVNEFQNLLETISALTSSNLQEKSWRQISQYLAYQLNQQNGKQLPFSNRDDPQYTVEWLIDKEISLYKEKIIFIVQKSQKEKQLQTNLGEFKTFISTIVFDTVIKNRQVQLIQKNKTLQRNLKQKISILYSLVGNQYSDSLKNDAETMIKHYEYLEQILQGMYTFREQWEKYESFFENNSVSTKLLTKQAKQFNSWQLQWKKIIKNITNDPTYFYRKICDQTMGINCSRAIIKSMNKANMFLDLVKKGIQQFLQKKRLQFPRYCLFTDEQLLSILSKLDNSHLIVPEIVPILYDNIKQIEYDEQSCAVNSVTSNDGQRLLFPQKSSVKSQSQTEDILKITEQQIKRNMANLIRSTFTKYIEEDISREQLLRDYNVQVSLLVDYIAWVRLAEETYLINDPVGTMHDWLNIQQQQIRQVAQIMKKAQSSVQYLKFLQFMVQSIYFRQKTVHLTKNQITDTSFYEWQRIPKMIMTNSQIHLRQLESKIVYNYELLSHKDVIIIQAETEKVWISLINAIAGKQGKNVIGLEGKDIQAIRDLAFYVGQTVKSVQFSQCCNIKTVERLLTGYMYLGCWMHFLPINNPQILSYIAYHINSMKRANNFESTSSTLQLTKSTMLNNSFSNAVFLFQSGQKLIQNNLIDPKNYRSISLNKPDEKHIMTILCEAEDIPKYIGITISTVCEFLKETFDFGFTLTHQYQKSLLNQIKQECLPKFSQSQLSQTQILEFIVINTVEENLTPILSESDLQIFQNFRFSFIPNYLILRSKHRSKLSKVKSQESKSHIVLKYVQGFERQGAYTEQFIGQAIKFYDMLMNNKKIGVILSGQILSGKSQIVKLVEKVHKFQLQNNKSNINFEVFKLYTNAYKSSQLLKSNIQQKREKKEKSDKAQKSDKQKVQKINEELGIFQTFLRSEAEEKWIILDGKVQKQLVEFTRDSFQNLVIPNYGLLSKQKYSKKTLEKVKILVECLCSSQLPPSAFYNYTVCHLSNQLITVDSMVKRFFFQPSIKTYLRFLSQQSISHFQSQLIFYLTKLEQKGNFKTKTLDFLYPFTDNEISLKTLKLIECVLKLNQESIREKEKNMKKTIEKFVLWAMLTVLYLHANVQGVNKVEKKFMEVCKYQGLFNQSVSKFIIYPSSGIEVHPVNGLRTQSSLFQIPQKGIITLTPKNDYSDFNNFLNQKANKFYEQISLETSSSIRVNYEQSNLFNYYSQLFSYCNQALVLYGQQGTGKKSILDLYAKNIRHKAFVHSIRYNSNKNLMQQYEKPFRKFNSLNGIVLKSTSVTKSIVVFVEDLSLVQEEEQAIEFLRMLSNDSAYVNRNGQIRKQTEQNNSLSILSNRIHLEESVLRLASRMMFFQTSSNTSEKLSSIFSPYLKAWSKANSLEKQVERIFCSVHGDTLLDATIKIMESMQEMFKSKKAEQNFSLQTILLRPRIGDLSKVLSCICLTQEANKLPINYYSELWANQIMRVFDDRLHPSSQSGLSKRLIELIKKEFLLKFKQNFQYNPKELFIFSSYLSGENRFYEKIQNLEHLQQMIENAYQSQTITVPVKLFFSQLLKEILKIYRILQISNGHMILFHLNKKVRQYLIQLASQIAETPFIQLKQTLLTVEKDILSILQYDESVSIYEDIEDITPDQIYQITCMLNRNTYDYQIKPEQRQKLKNRLGKYLKQMVTEMSAQRQISSSQMQKAKQFQGSIKQRQTLYLNQKLEDQLEMTMQQVTMNSVHFMFGASPTSQKSKKFLLNEVDLIGQMHFSFFQLCEESMVQLSKQILTVQQVQDQSESQENLESTQTLKLKQVNSERILQKCLKIYNSLPPSQQDYNSFLCTCENILSQTQRLSKQSTLIIEELEKTIKNYSKSLELISQNQAKLQTFKNQFLIIKQEEGILSKQWEDKRNQINELQLNVDEENLEQEEEKNQKLRLKNEESTKIQDELRQIKLKKDKNDMQTREARMIIKLSKDFIEIIQDITLIENQLVEQKLVQSNIENFLALWWGIVTYLGNKQVQEIIAQVNQWIKLIEFQNQISVTNADDILKMFQFVIQPLDVNIPAWQAVSPQTRLKGVIILYTLMHHQDTTSANRIITLYDPCKISPILFKQLPIDSQYGSYSLVKSISRYDEEFWIQTEKYRKGLIFLQETIGSKEKKEIQSHMIKRRISQLNRYVSFVDKRQKADVSFIFEKRHFVNYLKLVSLQTYEPGLAQMLIGMRDQYIRENKKIKQLKNTFKTKRAQMKFQMESDTEELKILVSEIAELEKKTSAKRDKIKLQNLIVKDQELINRIVDEVYNHYEEKANNRIANVDMMSRMYNILREKVFRLLTQLRQQGNSSNSKAQQTPKQQQSIKSLKQLKSQTKLLNVTQTGFASMKPSQKQIVGQISPSENFTPQEQQIISQQISLLLNNNLSSKVYSDDMFNLNILSLQLFSKIPIIIVQNNLLNYAYINREHKPINLLYNTLGNLLNQSNNGNNGDEKSVNNKILLFYNDAVHNSVLMDIVNKYLDQYKTNKDQSKIQRKHCIYLFTNFPVELLQRNSNLSNCNYQLFYFTPKLKESHSRNFLSYISRVNKLNEKSSKSEVFIRLMECLSSKRYFNNISQVQRYSQELASKSLNLGIDDAQLKQYLLDINFGTSNAEQLLQKVLSEQINYKEVNQMIQNLTNIDSEQLISNTTQNTQPKPHFEFKYNLTKLLITSTQDQLPYLFNMSDFLSPVNKDSLCTQLSSWTKFFNKKLKHLKHVLKQNLEQLTLNLSKIPTEGYLMPTEAYICHLNKEYKILKKLLVQNGMLIGPSPSMGKIVSTKAIGINSNSESNLITKNCMTLDDLFFSKKIFNLLKIRASRKLKIPYSRIGVLWLMEKRIQNSLYPSNMLEKLLSSTSPDIMMGISGETILGQLKAFASSSKQQKDSSKLLSMLKNYTSKSTLLIIVPYDTAALSQAQSANVLSNLLSEIANVSIKKKTFFLDPSGVKKDDNKGEICKVKIMLKKNSNLFDSEEEQVGTVDLPATDVIMDCQFVVPKIIIKSNLSQIDLFNAKL